MNRTWLKELTDLEGILATSCFSADWSQFDNQENMLINRAASYMRTKIGIKYDYSVEKWTVELTEAKHQGIDAALLKKVTLTDLDAEALVLCPDHFAVQHFKGGTWNKACDYLVLTRFGEGKYAFFIELKTSIECEPDNNGALAFGKSAYDASIVWQMLGADALFDGLVDVVFKGKRVTSPRAKSYKAEMMKCVKSDLAQYKRRYVVLFQNIKSLINTTGGGVQSTAFVPPNDACLESSVYVFQVENNECVSIGALVGHTGGP